MFQGNRSFCNTFTLVSHLTTLNITGKKKKKKITNSIFNSIFYLSATKATHLPLVWNTHHHYDSLLSVITCKFALHMLMIPIICVLSRRSEIWFCVYLIWVVGIWQLVFCNRALCVSICIRGSRGFARVLQLCLWAVTLLFRFFLLLFLILLSSLPSTLLSPFWLLLNIAWFLVGSRDFRIGISCFIPQFELVFF